MSPAERLAALLEAERAALLSGEFAALSPLFETKRALLHDLVMLPPAPGALSAIRADLARNARLFEAALSGLREGRARAEALHAARSGFATYDREGRSHPGPATPPALRRKA